MNCLQTTSISTTHCSALECGDPKTECQNPVATCLENLGATSSGLAGAAALIALFLCATKDVGMCDELKHQGSLRKVVILEHELILNLDLLSCLTDFNPHQDS